VLIKFRKNCASDFHKYTGAVLSPEGEGEGEGAGAGAGTAVRRAPKIHALPVCRRYGWRNNQACGRMPQAIRRGNVDDKLTAAEAELLAAAGEFAAKEVRPHAADWEKAREMPAGVFETAAAAGLVSAILPRDVGGAGATMFCAARMAETLAAADFGFTFALKVHANAANAVARRGTDEQRHRLLPDMIDGRRIGAFCLTEPEVGSDATAIACQATKETGGWSVTGQKAWVTNGVNADVMSVYVQTDAEQGWRGIANLLIEGDFPGLTRTAPYDMLGGHAAGLSGLVFDNCRVPDNNTLLSPGEGFKAAMAGINMARMFVAAICCGMLGDSLNRALEYGARRMAFGKPILSNQGLQWELADVATDLEACRRLTDHAARTLDAGEAGIAECAHAKKFATRAAVRGISACMQAMGAAGLRDDEPFARHFAAAKMCEFLDGTTEIQNVVISRTLLRPYGLDAS
jgi:alkylation response protein AidB-like acyl-CoA dehydrogenase